MRILLLAKNELPIPVDNQSGCVIIVAPDRNAIVIHTKLSIWVFPGHANMMPAIVVQRTT